MKRLTTIHKGVLNGASGQASQEALELRRNIGVLGEMGFMPIEIIPDNKRHAPHIGLQFGNDDHKQRFSEIAPALSRIFNHMCKLELPNKAEHRRENFSPTGITINYSARGQMVPWHRDNGGANRTTFSAVATLSGKGLFEVKDSFGIACVENIFVEEGDVHYMFNPVQQEQRRLHCAVTMGRELRISAGFQIPIVPLQQ